MTLETLIILARKHTGNGAAMESSARLCLADAIKLTNVDNYQPEAAKDRAIKSLAYSIGILHPDYRKATKGDVR